MDGDVGYRPSQEERLGEAVVESFADAHDGRTEGREVPPRARCGERDM